jgi:hypothetical protein
LRAEPKNFNTEGTEEHRGLQRRARSVAQSLTKLPDHFCTPSDLCI